MANLRALIIGGNGIISSSVTRLAVERGFNVTVVNRGTSTTRPPLTGVRELIGDAEVPGSVAKAIGDESYLIDDDIQHTTLKH